MSDLRDMIERALRESASTARDLVGHERLCGERWEQLRKIVEDDQDRRDGEHAENQTRLAAIDTTIATAKGGWAVLVWQAGMTIGLVVALFRLLVH